MPAWVRARRVLRDYVKSMKHDWHEAAFLPDLADPAVAARFREHPPTGIDLAPLAPLIGRLGLPFVTADLARRADGRWRLIELGDGQVSHRPSNTTPEAFLNAVFG